MSRGSGRPGNGPAGEGKGRIEHGDGAEEKAVRNGCLICLFTRIFYLSSKQEKGRTLSDPAFLVFEDFGDLILERKPSEAHQGDQPVDSTLTISGRTESLFSRAWRRVYGVFVRESGF
jgi:hypothetical protein